MGYVTAAAELEEQLAAAEVKQATIVTAVGTGGTLAGLMAGLALQESRHRLLGIDVGKLWKGFPASIAATASEICRKLGSPREFTASQVPMIEHTYVGEAYARPTVGGSAAIRTAARREGVVLDPVYSGKAMHGLVEEARRGRWAEDEDVVFVHTGGLPAVWALAQELRANLPAAGVLPVAYQGQ
jgi:D-cysteine desulfhydrase